jgi:hypothetical protein
MNLDGMFRTTERQKGARFTVIEKRIQARTAVQVLGVLDWIFASLAGHTSAWFLLSSAFARSSENINFVSVFVQSEKFNLTPHQLAFVVLKGRAQTLLTDARQSASNLQRYSPYVPHLFYSEYMPSDGFFDGIFYYEEFQTLL